MGRCENNLEYLFVAYTQIIALKGKPNITHRLPLRIKSIFNNPPKIINCIHSVFEKQTIGSNPAIIHVLGKAFAWNHLNIVIMVNGRQVARFSALNVRGTWVSLPHFDHGGLWIDWEITGALGLSLSGNQQENAQIWHRQLMRCIVHFVNRTPLPRGRDHQLCLSLTPDQIQKAASWPEGSAKVQYRSPFRESENATGGKVVSFLPLITNQALTPAHFRQPIARKIRRAMLHGLQAEVGEASLLNDFYHVYRRNIKELGSFGLPEKFFYHLVNDWSHGHCLLVVVRHKGKAVGAGVLLTYNGMAENAWFATLGRYNRMYVSYLLHFALMREAARLGCHTYGMGRSTTGSSVHRYKKQWETNDQPLFFNATFAQKNPASLYPRLKNLLRLIPMPIAKIIDAWLTEKIY